MIDEAKKLIKQLGYQYNDTAQNIIKQCDDWYSNKVTAFHKRTNLNGVDIELKSLNFAKRCCADDANLCEIVEINVGSKHKEENKQVVQTKENEVTTILSDNRFDTMYRKQLEKMAASGTVGCYVRLDNAELMSDGSVQNGAIRLNYCNASEIIPLTVINDEIVECAFCGTNVVDGKKETTLVIFTDNNGLYSADSYYFNDDGHRIHEKDSNIQLGNVKPFAIMHVAEVNNIKDMEGYGYPKIYSAIPVLETLDLAYGILYGDLSKGDKLVFVNEVMSSIQTDKNGKKFLTKMQKELFILLGEKLPDQDNVIQEYNPVIRITDIVSVFEMCLSLLSMTFGYGTKKYTFEQGQIITATEYAGQKQDSMQELNKQRYTATEYIIGICKAVMWFSNTFNKTNYNLDAEINIEYDDSFITDIQTDIEAMRTDAISFPEIKEFKIRYIMMRFNCEREQALTYLEPEEPETDDNNDIESKSMYKITSLLQKLKSGTITRATTMRMLQSLGYDETEADDIIKGNEDGSVE